MRAMPSEVRVFAPASASNLGPGFDVLGLALQKPGDVVVAELSERPGVEIVEVSGDGGLLSRDPAQNVAGVAAQSLLAQLSLAGPGGRGPSPRDWPGVRLRVHKRMPLASGLGSSAASSVLSRVEGRAGSCSRMMRRIASSPPAISSLASKGVRPVSSS